MSGFSQMRRCDERRKWPSSAASCAGSPRSQPSLMMITTAPCPSTRRAHLRLKSPSAVPMRGPPLKSCTPLVTESSTLSTSRWRSRRVMRVRRVEKTNASRSSRRATAYAKIISNREYRSIEPLTSQMRTSGRRRIEGRRRNSLISSPLDRIACLAERRRSIRPARAGRMRRVRRSATRQAACSSSLRTCSVSDHVMSSKSLCRKSSSALYPLELTGTSRGFCSRFICDVLSPSTDDHALARSGDIGSGRLRPGITPAVTRGSGGAQKMSNAASKVGMSSLRLTNTVRRALRKSTSRFMSMWTSARVASVSRRGPASRPASCSSLAKAPSRGSRSGRSEPSSGTLCLLDQGRHLLAHSLQVFLVLERGAERGVDERGIDRARAQRGKRPGPVQRLGHPRHLVQVHPAQALHQRRHLSRQPVGSFRGTGAHDLDLFLEIRVVDPVVQAAPLQRVVHLAGAVRRDDHERRLLRLDGPDLGNRDLEVRQQLEQERLELLVRPVDLVDQQDRRRLILVVDRVQQRPPQQELLTEDLAFREPAILALVEQPDVQELARVVPFIDRVREVDAFVALQADQPRAEHVGHDLGRFGLADPGLALDEQGLFELQGEVDGGRQRPVADVPPLTQTSLDVVDGCRGGRAHLQKTTARQRRASRMPGYRLSRRTCSRRRSSSRPTSGCCS